MNIDPLELIKILKKLPVNEHRFISSVIKDIANLIVEQEQNDRTDLNLLKDLAIARRRLHHLFPLLTEFAGLIVFLKPEWKSKIMDKIELAETFYVDTPNEIQGLQDKIKELEKEIEDWRQTYG